jgi:hypothetical protein
VGISQPYLAQLESGRRASADIAVYTKLAERLVVRIVDLVASGERLRYRTANTRIALSAAGLGFPGASDGLGGSGWLETCLSAVEECGLRHLPGPVGGPDGADHQQAVKALGGVWLAVAAGDYWKPWTRTSLHVTSSWRAKAGHRRLCCQHKENTWMPTCVGMTMWKRPLRHVEHLFFSES